MMSQSSRCYRLDAPNPRRFGVRQLRALIAQPPVGQDAAQWRTRSATAQLETYATVCSLKRTWITYHHLLLKEAGPPTPKPAPNEARKRWIEPQTAKSETHRRATPRVAPRPKAPVAAQPKPIQMGALEPSWSGRPVHRRLGAPPKRIEKPRWQPLKSDRSTLLDQGEIAKLSPALKPKLRTGEWLIVYALFPRRGTTLKSYRIHLHRGMARPNDKTSLRMLGAHSVAHRDITFTEAGTVASILDTHECAAEPTAEGPCMARLYECHPRTGRRQRSYDYNPATRAQTPATK